MPPTIIWNGLFNFQRSRDYLVLSLFSHCNIEYEKLIAQSLSIVDSFMFGIKVFLYNF